MSTEQPSIEPTLYVRHPDGTYSQYRQPEKAAAEPTPDAPEDDPKTFLRDNLP